VTLGGAHAVVGLVQVRQLDPAFEAAEWEGTIVPSVRGTGIFVEAARLVGSFTFGAVGTHRLEARVLLQNGRANGALRKLGAVQEGGVAAIGSPQRPVFRPGALVGAEGRLGRSLVSTSPRVH